MRQVRVYELGRTVPYMPALVVMRLLGTLSLDQLETPQAALMEAFEAAVRAHATGPLHMALRALLTSSETSKELAVNGPTAKWVLVRELFCAKVCENTLAMPATPVQPSSARLRSPSIA